jgi:peptidoglycan/LPS O-acetylase OafA/YrhL
VATPVASGRYRPEIDGLRTVAVIPVIFYHLGWSIAPGGFVGVDVFFVISGYLITKLIVSDIGNDRFSFFVFYNRRARRILPALFFTVALTFIAGAMLLSPFLLERLGGASLSATFSVSNFYFLSEAGYFDVSETVKPLLHTWSLGVEEQFYFIWPLLLVFLFGRKFRYGLAMLAVIGLTSLIGAELGVRWWPETAFFMTPFRIFEFAIGAVLVWLERWQVRRAVLPEISSVLGLAMIMAAVLFFTSKTPFPGINALLPSVGAALVIFGGKSKINSFLLANRLMSGGGKISYSLYLSHLPLIVLYRYAQNGQTSLLEDFGLLAATLVLSLIMYRYVETPFRRSGAGRSYEISNKPFLAILVFSLFSILVPTALARQQGGWQWRLPPELKDAVGDVRLKRRESWKYIRGDQAIAGLPFEEGGGQKVLIIGDSHSKSMFNAVYLNRQRFPKLQFRRFEFRDQCFYTIEIWQTFKPATESERGCAREYSGFVESRLLESADIVLVATYWDKNSIRNIGPLKDLVKDFGARLVVTSRAIGLVDVPELVLRMRDFDAAQKFATNNLRITKVNSRLRKIAREAGVSVLEMKQVACFGSPVVCPIFNDRRDLFYYDGGHWTLNGAEFFGLRMSEIGFFDPLLEYGGE